MPELSTWVGLDDTDSYSGGCTTWTAAQIAAFLRDKLLDFPYLIRLNPEIPWKTRGNGALALHVSTLGPTQEEGIKRILAVAARIEGKTDPGLVLASEGKAPRWLSDKALRDVVTKRLLEKALSICGETGAIQIVGLRPGLPRGLIGAMAAVGHTWGDYTFELIAYRDDLTKKREEVLSDVLYMDSLTAPVTFLNVDREDGQPLIYPHGPDPVLFGIRGEDPNVLIAAHDIVRNTSRPWVIFKTNQATNEHIVDIEDASRARPYTTVRFVAYVVEKPQVLQGGHVKIFAKQGATEIQVMVYRQTGYLNRISRELLPGDKVLFWGAVRPGKVPLTINLQGFKLLSAVKWEDEKPLCPLCGRHMEKTNFGAYRCTLCGVRAWDPQIKPITRRLRQGKDYLPSPSAFKHLMKPWNRRPLPAAYQFSPAYIESQQNPHKILSGENY